MIRSTTRLPLVDTADETTPARRRLLGAFILVDLALVLAVPVLAWIGFSSLLDSRSGQFVAPPTADQPGWLAFVEPSEVVLLANVVDDGVSGFVLLVPTGDGVAGGRVILVPSAVTVDGVRLSDRDLVVAARLLEEITNVRPTAAVGLDESDWAVLIGDETVSIDNPDPVPAADGEVLIEVGPAELAADTIPAFLGRSVDANAAALDFRRELFWAALLETDTLFADSAQSAEIEAARSALASISAGANRLDVMPTALVSGDLEIADGETRALLEEAVANPTGGDRLQIRILDRTGSNDLTAAARALGRAGYEVVQIGNATIFDGGANQVLASSDADPDLVAALASLLGADTVTPSNDEESVFTVTVLLGDDESITTE